MAGTPRTFDSTTGAIFGYGPVVGYGCRPWPYGRGEYLPLRPPRDTADAPPWSGETTAPWKMPESVVKRGRPESFDSVNDALRFLAAVMEAMRSDGSTRSEIAARWRMTPDGFRKRLQRALAMVEESRDELSDRNRERIIDSLDALRPKMGRPRKSDANRYKSAGSLSEGPRPDGLPTSDLGDVA